MTAPLFMQQRRRFAACDPAGIAYSRSVRWRGEWRANIVQFIGKEAA